MIFEMALKFLSSKPLLLICSVGLFTLTINCAKHEQENYSSEDNQNFKTDYERDPVKRVQKAISENDAKALKMALKSVDIDQLIPSQDGEITFLMQALNANKYYMAEILLEEGADPTIKNSKGIDAFEIYSKDEVALKILNKEPLAEDKLLDILIKDGIDPFRVGVVEWIGSKNVNINQKVGRTPPPLIHATNKRTKEDELYPVIAALLNFENVDVNIAYRGQTALKLAKKNRYQQITKLLISKGATE